MVSERGGALRRGLTLIPTGAPCRHHTARRKRLERSSSALSAYDCKFVIEATSGAGAAQGRGRKRGRVPVHLPEMTGRRRGNRMNPTRGELRVRSSQDQTGRLVRWHFGENLRLLYIPIFRPAEGLRNYRVSHSSNNLLTKTKSVTSRSFLRAETQSVQRIRRDVHAHLPLRRLVQ